MLVIDNVSNSLAEIQSVLPTQPNWHIILTSREELFGYKIQKLDSLNPSESLNLFKKHCSRQDLIDTQIYELLKSIDYHTLTIEVLSKSAQKQLYNFDQLRDAIDLDLRAMVHTHHNQIDEVELIERITSYLGSIFNLSQLSRKEQLVLKQFCFLPSLFHPYILLNLLIYHDEEKCECLLSEVLNDLAEKGWLLKNDILGAFKLHRIILEVVIKNLRFNIDDITPLIHSIRTHLYFDRTKDNPVDLIPWIPYGFSILKTFNKLQDKELLSLKREISLIQDRLGTLVQHLGNYNQSKLLFESALNIAIEIFGEDSVEVATLQSNLSLVHSNLGNFDEALIFSKSALSIGLKQLSHVDPQVAQFQNNLALVYHNLGNNVEARDLLEKALESDLKHFGEDHSTVAVRQTNLASIYSYLGNFEKAIELSAKALTTQLKIFGEKHPSTLSTLFMLGNTYFGLMEINNAHKYFLRAYKVSKELFPPFHPIIAKALSNLGSIQFSLNKLVNARNLYEKALTIQINILGIDHPDVAELQNNLAWVFIKLNQKEKSVLLWETALNTYANKLGPNHPMTLNIMEYLLKFHNKE